MVGTVCYLFSAAGFSQHLISSYKQSARPCEADVPTVFNPQRPRQAPFTERNWYRVRKATTGLEGWGWISREAQKIVGEHQESISKSACLRHCKSIPPSYPLLMTYKLTTGTMGLGEVRATTHGMGHHLWPAVWRGRKAWVYRDDELYASHWRISEDSKTQWHQAAPDQDGWPNDRGCSQDVLGRIFIFAHRLLCWFRSRPWKGRLVYHLTHGHLPTTTPFWPSLRTMYPTTGNWVRSFFDPLSTY